MDRVSNSWLFTISEPIRTNNRTKSKVVITVYLHNPTRGIHVIWHYQTAVQSHSYIFRYESLGNSSIPYCRADICAFTVVADVNNPRGIIHKASLFVEDSWPHGFYLKVFFDFIISCNNRDGSIKHRKGHHLLNKIDSFQLLINRDDVDEQMSNLHLLSLHDCAG